MEVACLCFLFCLAIFFFNFFYPNVSLPGLKSAPAGQFKL